MTQTSPFLSSFSSLVQPSADPAAPWLALLREAALARVGELGLPSTRHEAWRYTSVEPIARTAFRLADASAVTGVSGDAVASLSLGDQASAELVFVDGHFAPHLSSVASPRAGLRVDSLAAAWRTAGFGYSACASGRPMSSRTSAASPPASASPSPASTRRSSRTAPWCRSRAAR